jgi:hypothetical protein
MVRWTAVVVALALAAPGAAAAAELENSDGVLTFTAAVGHTNDVTFTETAPGVVRVTRDTVDNPEVEPPDTDPITEESGCTELIPEEDYSCVDVERIVADARDERDLLDAQDVDSLPVSLTGGDGNDALLSGSADATLTGGGGDDRLDGGIGDDSLSGGEGNDELLPDFGTDAITGGDGIDRVSYGRRTTPAYSLDGLPNDGATGENDLIGTDVEDITAFALAAEAVTITGDGRANRLTVSDGRGDITGGDGPDVLEGGPRDDTLRSRDGVPDTVLCGGGVDTVEADTLDVVSTTCENVSTVATPGGAFDDRPPLIAWTAPAAGAALSANAASTLAVNATDDRGVTGVRFYDDERLVCEDAEAPYTCGYQPRGGDVGRNTLIAVAVDGANQTSSVVRAVTVRRFATRALTLSLRPSRDRRSPYAFRATGQLTRPPTVSPSQGCVGTVTLTVRAGRRTVTTRRAKLTRVCTYRLTLRWRSRPASRLRLTARFGGNDVLGRRTARSRTVRLG